MLASTVWVYGATVGGSGERTEDAYVDLRRAGHLYVSTKLAAEMLMHSYQEMYGQEFTILRYGIPYGPRMRDALVVARFVQAAQAGQPITIAGTGEQQRNFVYVEDLAQAHVLALSPAAANQTLALEGDTPVSVNEIAETVQHLVSPVPIEHGPGRPADYDGVNISNRLAKELLNWSPTTPLAEGIRRYLSVATESHLRGQCEPRQLPIAGPSCCPAQSDLATISWPKPAPPFSPPRAGRRAASTSCGCSGGAPTRSPTECSARCWPSPACSTRSTSPRSGTATGWPTWPTRPRPGGSSRGCARSWTRTRPSWRSRSSRRVRPRSARSPALYPSMKHVVFSTDVTPHRLWVHPNVDLYLVTSQAAERAVRRFQPEASVLVVQAPVREPFYHPPTQLDARASFAVPPGERCVLLTTGAWGLGPVAEAAEALGDAGVHVLAVAGRNPKLEQRLRSIASRQPLIHPFGFTDRIPDLMAASDLVITSSGDTCTEARVIGRPLLLLDVVQGHGRDNLQHELELGDAAVASGRAADVVRATLAALETAKPPPSAPTRSRDAWHSSLTAALATIGL